MAEQAKTPKATPPTKIYERTIIVDTWRSGMHGEEIGIKQLDQYKAKETQFTRDMDLFGEVKEKKKDGEETIGFVGYRKGLWNERKDKNERRLVVKLFSKSMYYQGTAEEMVNRELMARMVWAKTYPCFTMIIDKKSYLVQIDKVKRTFPLFDWYFMKLIDENTGQLMPIVLKHKIGFGTDYRIINFIKNEEIGIIDGKKFDIGGQYNINLKHHDKNLVQNDILAKALILFCATIRFQKSIEKKIKKIEKKMKKGEWDKSIDDDELDLLRNPRSLTKR